MQKITTIEHAQRILRQREIFDAQVHQLLDFLLGQAVAAKRRSEGVEALLLSALEFTRMTMTHLEKTGHQEDAEVKLAVQRVVVALQKAQALIAPRGGDAADPTTEGEQN